MTPCAPSRKIACRAGIEWVIQRQRFGFTVHSLQESRMNDEHNMKKITNIPSIRVPSGRFVDGPSLGSVLYHNTLFRHY